MIVDNVLILFTSNPHSPQLRATLQLIQAAGREVFLQPLSQLQQEKRPVIKPAIKATLPLIQPN